MDESRLKEGTAIRRIREETLALLQGPRSQITFLYGVFGTGDQLDTPEEVEQVRKKQLGRLRLVSTETGGTFEDLGAGRFSVTLGVNGPTEEDPLMAVTLALKLLRMAGMTKDGQPLRIVTVTGRIPQQTLKQSLLDNTQTPHALRPHEPLKQAQKIMQECQPGSLLVDGMTARMIRDTHRCQRIKDLKGVLSTSNVPVYRVDSGSSATHATFEPSLCGRERETKRLNDVFQRIEMGEGPIFLTITGELGIGKTKLMKAFTDALDGRATIFKNPRERRRIDRWRRAPYSYFGEIIRDFFGIVESENAAHCRNKLVMGLYETVSPKKQKELPLEMAHYFGLLCQVDFPDSPYLQKDSPAQLEQSAFMAIGNYLEQASQFKPIILVLDDLYSADTSSLRLLKYLTQHLEPARVLILCSSRLDLLTEMEKDAQLNIPGERILLKPLSRDAARKLINEHPFDDQPLPEALCKQILDIAEGNPFFLREILRDIRERQSNKESGGNATVAFDIPGNIEGILLSRISRLGHQEREILQKAAIFGKGFWRGGVEMLFRQEADIAPGWRLQEGDVQNREDDLEQALEKLAEQGVIEYRMDSDFPGDVQYHFTPSWLQELVYQEVPKELLAPYHRLVAMWLELQSQRQTNLNLDAEIAHHFDLGEEPARSAPYHIKLGVQARKMYATERAIEHLEKGLAHLEESHVPKRMHALRELAEVNILDGAYDKALEQLEELLELSWQMGHRVMAGELYVRMGRVHYLMRNSQRALADMKNGHTLHLESGYTRGIATALSNMGEVYLLVGNYQQARLYLQEALDLRRDLDHPGDLAYALSNMGNLLIEQGELEAARTYHQEALDLRKSIGNPHLIIRSMNNLAMIHMIQGDYDAALAELLVSSNLAQKVGEKLIMSIVTSNISELYLLRGELEQAQKYLDRAMQIAERIGDHLIKAECYRLQGEIHLEEERCLDALKCCETAYQLLQERGIHSAISPILRLMAEIYAALPEDTQTPTLAHFPEELANNPTACYEKSIEIAHQHGNQREEGRTRMLKGIYDVNQGNVAQGKEQLKAAHNIFARLHMESERIEVAELIEEVDQFQQDQEREQQSNSTTSPLPPPPTAIPTSLRPDRSKLANVEKTMAFRVSFDESEMGPPPTPADLSIKETTLGANDESTVIGTTPPVPPSHKKSKALPPPPPITRRPKRESVHQFAAEKPNKQPPQTTASTTREDETPTPIPVGMDATVKRRPPLAELMQQGVLKHASTPPETPTPPNKPTSQPPPPPSTRETQNIRVPKEETDTGTAPQSDLASLELKADDMVLETIDVVDTQLYQERGEGGKTPTERTPPTPPKQDNSSTKKLKPPTKPTSKPGTTTQKNKDSKDNQEDKVDVFGAQPSLNIPSRLTPQEDGDAMPFLIPNKPVKEPSVYDSQVIIAQVAEDDDISRSWFEEGRSDRTKQFWDKHKQEREAVREDLLHEKVIEEIDKLRDASKHKKDT